MPLALVMTFNLAGRRAQESNVRRLRHRLIASSRQANNLPTSGTGCLLSSKSAQGKSLITLTITWEVMSNVQKLYGLPSRFNLKTAFMLPTQGLGDLCPVT